MGGKHNLIKEADLLKAIENSQKNKNNENG